MNTDFQPRNPGFEPLVRDSFQRQSFMGVLGAQLISVTAGAAEIHVPYREDLLQQHGLFHGGLIGTIADNAGGYATASLLAAGDSVLTVEYKLNLMAPAQGEALISRGQVIRPGRTMTVCRSDVFVLRGGQQHLCATMLGTFMRLAGVSDHDLTARGVSAPNA